MVKQVVKTMQSNSTIYQPHQDVQKKPESVFERVLHNISRFFGSAKTQSEEVPVIEDDMTFDEFKAEFENLPGDPSSAVALGNYPSLFEMSFLSKMIRGKFEGYKPGSFRVEAEKKLFLKYQSLSQEQRVEKYKQLEQQLNEMSLK